MFYVNLKRRVLKLEQLDKIVCAVCGVTFSKHHHLTKYCSKQCKKVASNNRSKDHYNENKQAYIDRAKAYGKDRPDKLKEYQKNRRENKKECIKASQKKYYEKHKDIIKDKSKAYNSTEERKDYMVNYRESNKDKLNGHSRKYKKKPRSKKISKNGHLKRKFGITLDDYNNMLTEQGGKCMICKNTETSVENKTGNVKDLAVDHCHSTGKIRGLLCFRCNTTIGRFEDDIELLKSAIKYIEENK